MKKTSTSLLSNKLAIPSTVIERRIYLIRGQEVMLDNDLAELYQVPTKALNQAVKRNLERFPNDFMFQLSKKEVSFLRSQIVTLETGRGKYSKYTSYAFTEHGVAMLSSVLKSERAIQMSLYIIRAFIELRKMLIAQREISNRLKKVGKVQKFHGHILTILTQDVKKMKNPPKINAIGFQI